MRQTQEKIATITRYIQHAAFDEAATLLMQLNYADQARVLEPLRFEQQQALLMRLEHSSQVFEFLPLQAQYHLAEQLPFNALVPLLDAMHSDDFIDLFKLLDSRLQQQLMGELSLQSLQELKLLAGYVEGTAGSMMSSNFVTLAADLSMDEAIQRLRQSTTAQDNLYLIYIVDSFSKLMGVISLREMILADPTTQIKEVMAVEPVTGHVFDDQEEIAKTLAYYDFVALPIVDDEQHLLGIVTYDDAMDIVEAETTEDFLKSGAVAPLSELSLKTAPIISLYRKRVFWLVFLVFGSLLSGLGIAHYEDIIATHIVLVFFLPLLVGSGGNAGSQSATLMVRALATGDVEMSDWARLLGREAGVALCLGGTMALAVSLLGYYRGDVMVAIVLALSMLGIVMMGCLIGMSLPFILKQFKLDPASASAPLVTSICDATGVIVYLFIASKILF